MFDKILLVLSKYAYIDIHMPRKRLNGSFGGSLSGSLSKSLRGSFVGSFVVSVCGSFVGSLCGWGLEGEFRWVGV
jgi:hypothetical protein